MSGSASAYDHGNENLTISPSAGLAYVYTKIDGFTETGDTGLELVFEDQSQTSLKSVVGIGGGS